MYQDAYPSGTCFAHSSIRAASHNAVDTCVGNSIVALKGRTYAVIHCSYVEACGSKEFFLGFVSPLAAIASSGDTGKKERTTLP